MSEGKIQLVGLSFEELEQWTLGQKQPRFRAKQLYGWLMKGAAFSEMTNLPAAFREVLEREALANPVRIERCVKSKLDGTEKFLYALEDGNLIEGVLMRYHHGNTLCLSTPVSYTHLDVYKRQLPRCPKRPVWWWPGRARAVNWTRRASWGSR